MKKLGILFLSFFIALATAFSQAKKPTIMVVPSDNWCIQNGYSYSTDNMGTMQTLPNYKQALQMETDLLLVIGKINNLMADRGFPLKNLESVLKTIETQNAELNMLTSRSGASISESPIDVLKRTAQADIIIQLTYKVNRLGPQSSVTYMMQGIDAYTNKQIAGAQGTGEPSYSVELPVLLEEAVLANIDNFNARLQDHFNDMFENGREVSLMVRVWDSSMVDLEEEYNYQGEYLELGEIIEDWIADNTILGRYNLATYTANQLVFEQVRIPLFDERERAMDTRRWVRDLRSALRNPPFSQECNVYTRGLGEVWIILGEK
jgi:hypothetical protein